MPIARENPGKKPPAAGKPASLQVQPGQSGYLAFQLFTQPAAGEAEAEKQANAAAANVTGGSPAGLPASPGGPSADATPSPFGAIIDDDSPLAAGQIHRSAFVQKIYAAIEQTADEELRPSGRTAADCPYLQHWLEYYRDASASHLERAIQRFANPATRDLGGIESAIVARVHSAGQEI